eukprot:1554610-Alexandrium_andersonii.AAC.1
MATTINSWFDTHLPGHPNNPYAAVRSLRRKHRLRRTGCSSNFGLSELAVQATSDVRNWLFKQLCERVSGTPAGPP